MTSKKFYFFKKTQKFRQKTQKCWVILYQHLCVFQMYVRSIVGTLGYSIPTYSLPTYNPQVHMPCWVTLKCLMSRVLYNTKKHGETSDKIWCIYLKIIKFYLISIFELTFMMNSMRHWNCAGHGHTFNKVEFHVSIFSRTFILASRDVIWIYIQKLIIFQI